MALIANQNNSNDKITGLIEIDEIYFKKSSKGNHKNGLDRPSRKHGYSPY